MKLDMSAVVGGYAAMTTALAAWLALGGATTIPVAKFSVIDVERINIREPNGTLRMVLSNHARMPGIVIEGQEYPHPNRTEGGMIFYNDEGTENGGLVFDGSLKNGRPTNGGSLTFDRWRQDQTIQLSSIEDGQSREASVRINDRPDKPMDVARATEIRSMPDGPAKVAAYRAAGFNSAQRVYLGRTAAKASELALRDDQGRARLVLRVKGDGAAEIRFFDATGRTVRTILPR